jgi:hypothetical protein
MPLDVLVEIGSTYGAYALVDLSACNNRKNAGNKTMLALLLL